MRNPCTEDYRGTHVQRIKGGTKRSIKGPVNRNGTGKDSSFSLNFWSRFEAYL